MIGIICALESEFRAVLNILEEKKLSENDIWPIYTGKVQGREVMVIQSGIGKVNAAAATMVLTYFANPDWVLNIGFSGGLNPAFKQGDVILCDNVNSHDSVGFEAGLGGWIDNYLEGGSIYADVLQVIHEEGMDSKINLQLGRAVSGDCTVTDREFAQKIREAYGADCVDMESASICQVCLKLHIPHAVIRILSDYCNKRAYLDFMKREKELLEMLGCLVKVMVKVKR